MLAPRAEALTDRTTTYIYLSDVSDPSELGSEPDSRLPARDLRAHKQSGWCVREERLGSPAPNRQRSTASRRKTHKIVPQQKLVRWWRRGPTYSRTQPRRTAHRAQSVTRASSAASPTAAFVGGSCARTNNRGGACVSRDWAPTPRTGRGARPAAEQKTPWRTTRVRWWCCGPNSRLVSIKEEEDVQFAGARGQGALPQWFGFT